VLCALHPARDLVLECGVERDARQYAVLHVLLGDMPRHRMAGVLGGGVRVPPRPGPIRKNLEDRTHIANGDALVQEICKYLLHFADGKQIRDDLVHKGTVGLAQIIEKVLRLLTP